MLYGRERPHFTQTASITRWTEAQGAGVKRIRIHDLRHSHISLLIDMGFFRCGRYRTVGHESIEITYPAHLFPVKQSEMAKS